MAMQERMPGNAHQKRNCWQRGNGSYSMRGELRHGISLNKKYLNRKVRHSGREALKHGDYKRICKPYIWWSSHNPPYYAQLSTHIFVTFMVQI